jgi:hypothetical protein
MAERGWLATPRPELEGYTEVQPSKVKILIAEAKAKREAAIEVEHKKARLLSRMTKENLLKRVMRLLLASPFDREDLAPRLIALGVPASVVARALDEIRFRPSGNFIPPITFYVTECGQIVIDPLMLNVLGGYEYIEERIDESVELLPIGKDDGIIIPDEAPKYEGVSSVDFLDNSAGFEPLEVEVDGVSLVDTRRYIERNRTNFERAQYLDINVKLDGRVKPVIL